MESYDFKINNYKAKTFCKTLKYIKQYTCGYATDCIVCGNVFNNNKIMIRVQLINYAKIVSS